MKHLLLTLAMLLVAVSFPAFAAERDAEINRGVAAQRNGDVVTAIGIFKEIAKHGDALAEYNLGIIYAGGKGVPRDDEASAKWHRRAADHGNVSSQFNFGVYLNQGRGVVKNAKEALRYYRLAAEQGDTKSQYNVGLMHTQGRGTAKNYVQGYKWLAISASKGYEPAIKMRNIVKHLVEPEDMPKAKKLARDWMSKHPG